MVIALFYALGKSSRFPLLLSHPLFSSARCSLISFPLFLPSFLSSSFPLHFVFSLFFLLSLLPLLPLSSSLSSSFPDSSLLPLFPSLSPSSEFHLRYTGTSIGGLLGPIVFTWLLSKGELFIGYLIAAALMIFASIVEWFLGIDAEGKTLEQLAPPISTTKTTTTIDVEMKEGESSK